MENPKLGELITGNQERDAVHIAVVPVVAGEPLASGQHVGIAYGKAVANAKPVGVVDPFLCRKYPNDTVMVLKGQRFWLLLYPGSITSLRHDWTHPALEMSESEKWLRDFARDNEIDYDTLVDEASNGKTVCFGSTSGPERVRDERWEFWGHMAAVTGLEFDEDHINNAYFRCAC